MSSHPWYQSTTDAATIPPAVAQRALDWLMALQDEPVAPATTAAWHRWLAEHPDHERAWRRVESVMGQLQPLACTTHAAIAQATLAPASRGRRRALSTLALLAFAGGGGWLLQRELPWLTWQATHRTQVGERRNVMLADGTELILNTDSAVDVLYDDTLRRVRLLAGEILVTTSADAHPAPRPFLIETPQGIARALGTRYTVRLWDEATEVCVFDGKVQLEPRSARARHHIVSAGHRACYTSQSITHDEPADELSVAWTEGFLVARDMRLDRFLDELRRHTRETLRCDPSAAALRVSGSFPLGDVRKVLEVLSITLDLRLVIQTRYWGERIILVEPRAKPRAQA